MLGKKNQDYVPNTKMNRKSQKYVEIIEEPMPDGTRFRYENEGRSAGRIKGVNYTEKCKTYPTIKIHGYQGRAFVVVSLVTNEPPYYPHPHKLIGNNCNSGVCSKELDNPQMIFRFSDLRIQCVKRKDVKASLDLREKYRVDPFATGFSHSSDINKITFDAVRLCFQVFLPDENGKYRNPLPPVISSPIYDSKTGTDLAIMKLSHCTAPVSGDQEIILLCGQINKNDIQIVFEEVKDKKIIWTANGKFLPHDVHRKSAISFKTPPYKDPNVQEQVDCFIYLRRPSDNLIGKRRKFTLLPVKEHKRPKLEYSRLVKVIEQGNLAEENFVDKNSRPKIRAVKIGAKLENFHVESRMKHTQISSSTNYENGAGKQFHVSHISERQFKSPGIVNVHGNENNFENVPSFSNYQNTAQTAGDTTAITSLYTQDQFEDIFPANTPPVQLNNAEVFCDSPSTADYMSSVVSPYTPQIVENVVFSNSPQNDFSNDGTSRGFLEDNPPVTMNNFNLESNPNDAATMSGLSITSNAEMDLLNYIGAFKDGNTADESPPFHMNLRDNAVENGTGHSLEELHSLNLNSDSSDLDTNMSRLTIDSISESIAISILVDSHDVKAADQQMSF